MQVSPDKLGLILKSIADDSSVKILLEIEKSDTYPQALSEKLGIPKSTVWKKISQMEKAGILEAYFGTGRVGRRVKMYRFKDRELDLRSVSDLLRCFEQK